ncbi:MAG: transposase [Methanosphaera stadtmanae]|nr:transposase [Methanosphaera stadtmanae]
MLTVHKKSNTWLRELDSQALLQSLRNLETAFKRFFKGTSKYPRYKSKYNPIQSYKTLNINNCIRINGNRIRLPKVGWIKFRTKQKIQDKIKSVTVSKNPSGKYTLSILCDNVPQKLFKRNDRSCGLDLGITNFVTINTGEKILFPEQDKINRLNKKIKRLQRSLSKKKKGSNNYKKQKKRIAKAYEKIHNTLKYHFYKISQRLTEKYQVICMETLNIKGMLKNSKLSNKISEKAWHMFTTILKQKCQEHGRTLIQIDQWYPSSKICNICQHKNQKLTLKQRTWTCTKCHTTHNRDVNAAKNIHKKGLKELNT